MKEEIRLIVILAHESTHRRNLRDETETLANQLVPCRERPRVDGSWIKLSNGICCAAKKLNSMETRRACKYAWPQGSRASSCGSCWGLSALRPSNRIEEVGYKGYKKKAFSQ